MMSERNETGSLYMVQLWLEARRLVELGHMLGLFSQRRRVSTNYLVHCALGELFQDQAPRPFSVEDTLRHLARHDDQNGQLLRVLGYASVDDETLHELAKAFASPAVYTTCRWDRLAAKPMPGIFPEGLRVRFEARVCPVVRKASAGETSTGKRWKKGQELDAFLSEAWERPDEKLSREAVYCDWFRRHLARRGGAEVEAVGLERFAIERMTRRTHGQDRRVQTIKRPDVTLTGRLQITDGPAFEALLKRGIGRHTSFGFGMLKIRRA